MARRRTGLDPQGLAHVAPRRAISRRTHLRGDMPGTVRRLERHALLDAYFRDFPLPFDDPRREARRFADWTKKAVRRGRAPPELADLAAVEAATADLRGRTPRAPGVSVRPRRAPRLRLLRLRHDPSRHFSGRRGAWPRRESWLALHLGPDGRVHPHRMDRHDFEVLRLANGRRSERAIVDRVAASCDVWNREAQRSIRELRREGLLAPDR